MSAVPPSLRLANKHFDNLLVPDQRSSSPCALTTIYQQNKVKSTEWVAMWVRGKILKLVWTVRLANAVNL